MLPMFYAYSVINSNKHFFYDFLPVLDKCRLFDNHHYHHCNLYHLSCMAVNSYRQLSALKSNLPSSKKSCLNLKQQSSSSSESRTIFSRHKSSDAIFKNLMYPFTLSAFSLNVSRTYSSWKLPVFSERNSEGRSPSSEPSPAPSSPSGPSSPAEAAHPSRCQRRCFSEILNFIQNSTNDAPKKSQRESEEIMTCK